MHDNRTHPLLAQIPLTVSPFISLPTATTLPYTYKTLPSTLPPSSTGDSNNGDEKPKYVMSKAGHLAAPDEIIESCIAFQNYVTSLQPVANKDLTAWEEAIEARELAEKRRVAPGWLDSDARILEPEKKITQKSTGVMDLLMDNNDVSSADASGSAEGEELDRAFGGQKDENKKSADGLAMLKQHQSISANFSSNTGASSSAEGEQLDRSLRGLDIK